MNTIIKSLKFSGYRAFEDEVVINFGTNKSKYNYKDSVRTLKRNEIEDFDFNNHLGFIGPNAAGKTSILAILKIYQTFLLEGAIGFNRGIFNPITGLHDYSYSVLHSNDLNINKEYLEITIELVNEKSLIRHNLKIKKDLSFSEKIEIQEKKNKNLTWEKLFEKDYGDKIDFLNYSNWAVFEAKNNNKIIESAEKIKVAAESLRQIGHSIISVSSQTTARAWANDLHEFLSLNYSNVKLIEEMQEFITAVSQSVDQRIKSVSINNKIVNNFPTFDFIFVLKNNKKIPHFSLSDGTWKIIGIFTKLYLLKLQGKKNVYVLIDEIDNSWHPNLTRIFLRLIKSNMFLNTIFLFTFHNPYIASEVRHDALYLVSEHQEVMSWPEKINEFNQSEEKRELRLENTFETKYLDEVICSGPENFRPEVILDFFGEY